MSNQGRAEYVRLIASLHESARVFESEAADLQAMADMLRRRGHEEAARQLEDGLAEAQRVLEDAKAKIGPDWNLPYEEGVL